MTKTIGAIILFLFAYSPLLAQDFGIVEKDGKFGLVDENGKIHIDFIYDEIEYLSSKRINNEDYTCFITNQLEADSLTDKGYGLIFKISKNDQATRFISINEAYENVCFTDDFEFFTLKNGKYAKMMVYVGSADSICPYVHHHGEHIVSTLHFIEKLHFSRSYKRKLYGYKPIIYLGDKIGYLLNPVHYILPENDDLRWKEVHRLNVFTSNGYIALNNHQMYNNMLYFVKKDEQVTLKRGEKNGAVRTCISDMPYKDIDDYRWFATPQKDILIVSNKYHSEMVYYTLSDPTQKVLRNMNGTPLVSTIYKGKLELINQYKEHLNVLYYDTLKQTYTSYDIEWILGVTNPDITIDQNVAYASQQRLIFKLRNSDRCIVFEDSIVDVDFQYKSITKKFDYIDIVVSNGKGYEFPPYSSNQVIKDSIAQLENKTASSVIIDHRYQIRKEYAHLIVQKAEFTDTSKTRLKYSFIDPYSKKTLATHYRKADRYDNYINNYHLEYSYDTSMLMIQFRWKDKTKKRNQDQVEVLAYINDNGESFDNIGGYKSARYSMFGSPAFNRSMTYLKTSEKIPVLGFNMIEARNANDSLFYNSAEIGFGLGESYWNTWDTRLLGPLGADWYHFMFPYVSAEFRFLRNGKEGTTDKLPPVMLNLGATGGTGFALLLIPISVNLYGGLSTDFHYVYLKGSVGLDVHYLNVNVGYMLQLSKDNPFDNYANPVFLSVKLNLFN
jgi:hypothetical protein